MQTWTQQACNLWQQLIENSFPAFSEQAGSSLFSKSILQLNKCWVLWSSVQLWLWSEGNIHQECGLDIQEPSEQTLISTVQIRQWSWVVPFQKITHVYKYNATVSELCLFYWINHASIYFITDVHITHLLPPVTQSGAAAASKSWRDVHIHI